MTDWLHKVLADPTDLMTRMQYAAALERDGAQLQADIVRLTCRAIERAENVGLAKHLQLLPGEHTGWARLIGARLISEMETRGLSSYVPRWLPHTLPALSASVTPMEETPPVGATFFWGDPDLPEGTDWPTFGHCANYFGEIPDIDPASRCHFVGQFNLADLSRSPALSGFPASGLLSIFAFDDWERHGISAVAVRVFHDVSRLHRVRHPLLDEANERRPCHHVSLEDVLTIPEDYDGPWSDEMTLAKGDDNDDPGFSYHRQVLCESGGERFGLFGHLRSTTGGDPTPNRDWQRFLCVPGDPRKVVWHHLAIRRDDLAAGNFDRWQSVWVDMDG